MLSRRTIATAVVLAVLVGFAAAAIGMIGVQGLGRIASQVAGWASSSATSAIVEVTGRETPVEEPQAAPSPARGEGPARARQATGTPEVPSNVAPTAAPVDDETGVPPASDLSTELPEPMSVGVSDPIQGWLEQFAQPAGGQADPAGGQADPAGGQADPAGGQATGQGDGQPGEGALSGVADTATALPATILQPPLP